MKLNFENAKVIIQPRKGGLEPAIFITESDKIHMVTIGPDSNFYISDEGNVGERYDSSGNYCEGSKQNSSVDFVSEDRYDEMEESNMKRITEEQLKELPFGSMIRIIWNDSCYHKPDEEYCGVIFGDKIGYDDGKIDSVSTIAESIYNNCCMVYLM